MKLYMIWDKKQHKFWAKRSNRNPKKMFWERKAYAKKAFIEKYHRYPKVNGPYPDFESLSDIVECREFDIENIKDYKVV